MNILVTGAGGFIGSHLVDRLKKDGHRVCGVDVKPVANWIKGDSTPDFVWDSVDVRDLLNFLPVNINLCYHLGAVSRISPSIKDPIGTLQANAMGTAAVLSFCSQANARVIYAGSSTADEKPHINPYALSKWMGENLCQMWAELYGMRVRVARFYNVYGPREVADGPTATVVARLRSQYARGEQLTVTGDGSQRRDFIHVEDVVSGLITIADRGLSQPDFVFPLGSGQAFSIREIAKIIAKGDLSRISYIPRPLGELQKSLASNERTCHLLNWKPKHTLKEYLEGPNVSS